MHAYKKVSSSKNQCKKQRYIYACKNHEIKVVSNSKFALLISLFLKLFSNLKEIVFNCLYSIKLYLEYILKCLIYLIMI